MSEYLSLNITYSIFCQNYVSCFERFAFNRVLCTRTGEHGSPLQLIAQTITILCSGILYEQETCVRRAFVQNKSGCEERSLKLHFFTALSYLVFILVIKLIPTCFSNKNFLIPVIICRYFFVIGFCNSFCIGFFPIAVFYCLCACLYIFLLIVV